MKKLSDFPNLQIALQKVNLMNQVIENIFRLKTEDTLIGLSIITGIENNVSVNDILSRIKYMAEKDRQAIDNIIGNDLTEQILALTKH